MCIRDREIEYSFKTESGQIKKEKRVIEKCTGQRREMEGRKKEYEYEVKWADKPFDSNSWLTSVEIIKYNKIY